VAAEFVIDCIRKQAMSGQRYETKQFWGDNVARAYGIMACHEPCSLDPDG